MSTKIIKRKRADQVNVFFDEAKDINTVSAHVIVDLIEQSVDDNTGEVVTEEHLPSYAETLDCTQIPSVLSLVRRAFKAIDDQLAEAKP